MKYKGGRMMKIAFSGAHGTGKTTSVLEKAKELKIKYPTKTVGVLSENAINCPLPINQEATTESQLWIFGDQLRKEIEMTTKFNILVCDRSIFDTIAYTKLVNEDVAFHMFGMIVRGFVETYDTIYFKRIQNNDFFVADGLRDTDREYRQKVEDALEYMFNIVREMKLNVKIIEI